MLPPTGRHRQLSGVRTAVASVHDDTPLGSDVQINPSEGGGRSSHSQRQHCVGNARCADQSVKKVVVEAALRNGSNASEMLEVQI